jgi:peptidoglycan/LPS O-acetylase OafA/YrhL
MSHERRTVTVNFGLRTLLLLGAVIVFVLAVFSEENAGDLIAWGLAAVALSFLLGDMGWDRRYGARR